MSSIWKRFKEDELNIIGSDGIENETQKRDVHPDLYDAALCLYAYNDLEYLSTLINEKRIGVNDLNPITQQSLLFLAIVNNRVDAAKFLIHQGANLEYLREQKDYLFWAVFTNCDIELLQVLLATQKFKLDIATLMLAIRKTEAPQIKLLITQFNESDLDEPFNEGDEKFPIMTTVFEQLVEDNFYTLAEELLTCTLPNTWEKLKNNDYLTTLDRLIATPPLHIDFSPPSSRKRTLPNYSQDALRQLKVTLEKVLDGKI